jgi:ABC-2 type transport system ATP-binding protein
MYSLSAETIDKNIEVLLRLMELRAHSHVLAQHLSGGMKRRLDIACALIHNPPVLIMDEPTADLDPVLRTHIWEVVKRINQRGTTIILSSHHLHELDTLCSRIGILKDGKLVELDTPERLKSKYSKEQELMVESFPGNYDDVIKRLKSDDITSIRREGTYLTIRTENPERVITSVLTGLHKAGESLLDLKLIKPNMDTVFLTIAKSEPHTTHAVHRADDIAHPPPLDKAHSLARKNPAAEMTKESPKPTQEKTAQDKATQERGGA